MPRELKEVEGKRYSLNAKTSLDLNLALKAAATRAGRSVSQEVEMRLERSFLTQDFERVARETIRQEMRAEFEARREREIALSDSPRIALNG